MDSENNEEKSRYSYKRMKRKLKPVKKKPPTKYSDLMDFGCKPKTGMSQHQLKTYNKFMKVKDGETREEWLKRTRTRRVVEKDEIKDLPDTNKLRIYEKKKSHNSREYHNRLLKDQSAVRNFDFLKYYGMVMNYYAIKYGMKKEDLEVGFYFYEYGFFTKDIFHNVCVLIYGSSKGHFNRFLSDEYICPVVKTNKNSQFKEVEVDTGYYKLHHGLVLRLKEIYEVIAKKKPLRVGGTNGSHASLLSKEEKQLFQDMNQDITEILAGNKPAEKLNNQ